MSNVSRWFLPLFLAIIGGIAAFILIPIEAVMVKEQLAGFPDSDVFSNSLRPIILGVICFMPALAALAYCFGSTFDRYLARQFMAIFGICLAALFVIWMLLDLNDNLGDFGSSDNKAKVLFLFYLYRMPSVLLLLLPYSLLLALIYGLGKFSKTNEIIAIVQSGTGVVRVCLGLILTGLWCSALLLGLNYHWAPRAEGFKDEMIAKALGKPILEAVNVLYRAPDSPRLWMVGAFPEKFLEDQPLQNVEVTTIKDGGGLSERMFADQAWYERKTRKWTFGSPLITRYTDGQAPVFEKIEGSLEKRDWPETPSQIIKPGKEAEYQGIPELSTWLASPLANQAVSNRPSYLTQWHYRWALPMSCIVTVLLAAPLSIHFARRGAGSGIFLAIVLIVLMLFVSSVTLALGEAAVIPAVLAAWLPNLIFSLMGLYLFHLRITGRPIYQSVKRLFAVNS
ncbi:MAG: LptF/LptG family permease [Luteolibacter sp.]